MSGYSVFTMNPLDALADAAGELWNDVEETVVKYVPGGGIAAALVETGRANFVEVEKEKPGDALGTFEETLSRTYDDAGDAASNAYSHSALSDTVDAGLEKAQGAVDEFEKKKKQALTLLDYATNPWVIGGAAVVVGLAVLGPYVLPFLNRGK